MRRYFKVASNGFQINLIYRFNNFMFVFSQFFSFGIFFYLWVSVYRQGGQIGNYTLAQMIFYYLTVNFVSVAFGGMDIARHIGDDIRQGDINNFLAKPVNYFNFKLAGVLGGVAYRVIVAILVFSVLGWFFGNYFDFSFQPAGLFFFFLSACFGFFISYQIFYLIGLSTFWFGFIMGFNFAARTIISFLEGGIVPLDLLPQIIIDINNWLPFKYIVFVPVSIFSGRLAVEPNLFLAPLFWIILLYFINRLTFKIGLKKYEGFGA